MVSTDNLSILLVNLSYCHSQRMVFVRNGITRIMRGQSDVYAVINVGPLRMVPSRFGGKGHLRHESEGGGEISELKFAIERIVLGRPGHGLFGIKT